MSSNQNVPHLDFDSNRAITLGALQTYQQQLINRDRAERRARWAQERALRRALARHGLRFRSSRNGKAGYRLESMCIHAGPQFGLTLIDLENIVRELNGGGR